MKDTPIAFLILALAAIFQSCAAPPPRKPLEAYGPFSFREEKIVPTEMEDFEPSSLLSALEGSLAYLEKMKSAPSAAARGGGEGMFSPDQIQRSLIRFREILMAPADRAEIEREIKESFSFWEGSRGNSTDSILLTGYYEPILSGGLETGEDCRYPLYRRPDDLREVIPGESASPYYSRREIDTEGALRGKGLELVWLKDPWERFVLHIQGSGQVRLPDGKIVRVGYAGSNGRPYRSIGRYLIEQGFLNDKNISMEKIRDFIQRNPGLAQEVFNYNERYIFFRILPDSEGPVGALGVRLTPGRSIATDLTLFPAGALAYLISREPDLDESGKVVGWKPIRRFVLNQDTGAAIKGPGRVDLFFGSGERAGTAAGEMREEGRIYFLLAK
jgi:membrane-bound lytic murein transglycosylase A